VPGKINYRVNYFSEENSVDLVHRVVDRARGGSLWASGMDGAELHWSMTFGRSGARELGA
jgi:hypothetical protein